MMTENSIENTKKTREWLESSRMEFEEKCKMWNHENEVDDDIRSHEAWEAFNTITYTTINAIKDCYDEYCSTLGFDD